MTSKLKHLQDSGVAPSTRLTYRSGIRAFETFCSQYDIYPILPASELTLCYFIAYLSERLSSQTARVYLSGIRLLHLEHGHGDPLQQADLLKYVLNGLQRSQTSHSHPRQPVTVSILRQLKASLQAHRDLNRFDKRLLWSAFTLAFYGFLRGGELTCPSATQFNPARHLSMYDVTVSNSALNLTIKASKTDQFGKSVTRTIPATRTSTCPVKAMQQYLQLRKCRGYGPLFMWHSGRYLTREALSHTLKELVEVAGWNSSSFSSHSFRIGAATTAAATGLPDWLIQSLGRWKSDSYLRYIRTPSASLEDAAITMARAARISFPKGM